MQLPFSDTIKLNQMDQVKLMSRMDTKYWFHIDKLSEIFEMVKTEYLILQINELKVLPYSTVYYDTACNSMYLEHHNGKLNRYKVRQRTYIESGIKFLEIKKKNNKGRTIKNRILSNSEYDSLKSDEASFINFNSPYKSNELIPLLQNNFDRITLVNKNFNERCTIDFNLQYINQTGTVELEKLVVVEVKSDGQPNNSPLCYAMNNMGLRKTGFSKYCIGRVLTDPGIKSNAFKPKVRQLTKAIFSTN